MNLKLFDSELRILEILWEVPACSAKEIAEILKEQVGWSKTTTYTVIKKCVDKGAISRHEPGFMCRALVSRQEVQETETNQLIDRMYGGAADQLVASLLGHKRLSPQELERLRDLVGRME